MSFPERVCIPIQQRMDHIRRSQGSNLVTTYVLHDYIRLVKLELVRITFIPVFLA